ncbi:MAG: NAD-dependent epimerase/dehydratase family protein [Verrucomicrobiales bacterium]
MENSDSRPLLLVAGCGYLGKEVARLFLDDGWRVVGLSRAPEKDGPAGLEWLAADLGDGHSVAAVRSALPRVDAMVHAASSSRGGTEAYERVFVAGLRHLTTEFPGVALVFTSSTSVYGQTDGSVVTEDSPAEPGTETGRLLRQAEDIALAAGAKVARLAGIYGPGRAVILGKLLRGEAVIEDGGKRVVNQIHRDDAARAIQHLLARFADTPHLVNVADDTPMEQRELLEQAAARLGLPVPPEGPRPIGRKRGWTSKAVSNARLRTTGWSPLYPDFLSALDADAALVPSMMPKE